VSAGTTTITVTTQDGNKTATCAVTVNAANVPVTSVSLNKNTLTLDEGKTETLTATVSPSNATNKNVTWSSSNTSVATVSNGTITSIAAGSASITVTTADGSKTATCTVTVNGTYIFNSITAFGSWLTDQRSNSPNNPYNVKLNVNDLSGISSVLTSVQNRYVFLDFSGSSFTTIPEEAFYYRISSNSWISCENLVGIIIPNGVTSIGENAFQWCLYLSSVNIPNGVTSIGKNAFYYCTRLTSISIPDSVTSIVPGYNYLFFSGCKNLNAINVGSGNSVYASENGVLYNKNKTALYQCPQGKTGAIIIPNSVTSIGNYSFYECESITSVTISNSVTIIGEIAFAGCQNLSSLTIGSGVTSIGEDAFANCHSLKSITVPDSVISIGQGAFRWCENLASITLGSGVLSIGSFVFDTYNLTTINVSSGNNTYSSDNGILYSKDKKTLFMYPKGRSGSFTIPNSVTSIEGYSFSISKITSVIIPSSVTVLNYNAFGTCLNLISVTFQGTISYFSSGAFLYTGDLYNKFYATDPINGTPGTYTTSNPGENAVWTKQ
jgi:hypothetical protein